MADQNKQNKAHKPIHRTASAYEAPKMYFTVPCALMSRAPERSSNMLVLLADTIPDQSLHLHIMIPYQGCSYTH